MNWEVKLLGDPVDLRMLAEVFVGPDLVIAERGSKFFLQAPERGALGEPGVVRERTGELLAVLSGASKRILGTDASYEVDCVVKIHGDGTRSESLSPGSAKLKLRRLPVTLVFTHPDGRVERRLPAEPVADAARKAAQSAAVRKSLRLCGAPDLLWTDP